MGKNRKGQLIKHPRKNMWGHVVFPSMAYANFKSLRAEGWYHPKYTWKMCCMKYRKKIRKIHIAKMSRRRNRRK